MNSERVQVEVGLAREMNQEHATAARAGRGQDEHLPKRMALEEGTPFVPAKNDLQKTTLAQRKPDAPARPVPRAEKRLMQWKTVEEDIPKLAKNEGSSTSAQFEKGPPADRADLPDQPKADVEGHASHWLHDVKVHSNSAKQTQLDTLSYAQGSNIHVIPGQEGPLPYEARNIMRQTGRDPSTMQIRKAAPINDQPGGRVAQLYDIAKFDSGKSISIG